MGVCAHATAKLVWRLAIGDIFLIGGKITFAILSPSVLREVRKNSTETSAT
jgi:hypothetical protein